MAGGYATRLWPITKTKPKPLLPLGKKTIIDLIYEKIRKFGYPIYVSTNKRFENDFKKWAKDKDARLIIEETLKEEEKLGAVRALGEIAKDLDDELFVIAGDNLFSFNLEDMLKFYKTKKSAITALYDVGDVELAKRYGVAEIDNDRIVRFYEKPEKPPSTLVGIGIYILNREAVDYLVEYTDSGEKRDNLGDFLSYLCQKTEVYGYPFTNGNWYDVGNADSYIEALKFYIEYDIGYIEVDRIVKIIPPVVIEDGCVIRGRSMIGPYAYIGKNCYIENSDVSESVIFDDVVLRKAKLWRSIIDEKCEIRNLELSGSIIGGHAKIQRGEL
ncbi:Nucleoside-diphosphate-sugar pyrophosphorylase involved in lipopolysaccharide biosynthesis/translation initiation factor 2B, gamma/epsilon subunits (eIF-2Bgamma/eIF-2Bepsilon) [Archaeoglobus sulfaticallidus PM70-1]|uniref:Nucleoside-diphosphate-sugar pyrophosphorylase involved in lipopolysaccharide biosynthesis/translation initiation factor 2B, gamma/epsilon subunits (EIF-2Bgamma/eIF-2Bepsilon) n=2 Tax=Archaeoglobus TaxID=2233 RepID=N0BNX4_9EURY|nr:Nucleoside-diphosphate-sugar pyrophosphorylase involved in lipopolysaccharide biosynthesis/translation initiation factor 2B, gamma/epsilon subunits (eIF-2Bgamma/eIF-2Bepsilon) [Archaeoglobus sulfaticallidus PM70-1]